MQDADTVRIAEEDQKMLERVQAAFHEKVAKAEADYKRSIADSISFEDTRGPRPPSSARSRD